MNHFNIKRIILESVELIIIIDQFWFDAFFSGVSFIL